MKYYKTIPGFSAYEIACDGTVRNKRTKRIIESYLNRGYHRVILWDQKNRKRKRYVHRLVAKTFIPNIYFKPQVHHIDHNRLNNNLSNLEWVTNKENQDYIVEAGRNSILYRKGQEHPNAKYSNQDIIVMKTLHENGMTYKRISDFFGGIPEGTLSGIINGKSREIN